MKVVALRGQPSNQGRRTADNNELQAPHRIAINLGNSGAPTQIARAKSCKTRRERKLEDESGLSADDFCNSETISEIRREKRRARPGRENLKRKGKRLE